MPLASSHGRNSSPPHRAVRRRVGHLVGHQPRHLGAVPVAVGDQARDRAEDEERQEDVEQRQPRQHELQAVEAEQQPGDQAEGGRAGHPAGQPAHHQHHQRADHGRGDPPAERVHPERLLAQRDQPLAGLGVDDHRRVVGPQTRRRAVEDLLVGAVDVAARVAVVQQRPRVLGVVGLVELEDLGRPELPEPQEQRQQREADAGRPADDRVLEVDAAPGPLPRRRHPPPRRVGREAGLLARGERRRARHDRELYGPARCHDRRHGRDPGDAGARGHADRPGRGRLAAAGRASSRRPTWSRPRTPGGSSGSPASWA